MPVRYSEWVRAGLYVVLHSSKGLGMGKEMQGGKKRKLRGNLGEKTFGSTKSKKLISKTEFNTIYTLKTLFYCYMGRKIIDFVTRRDASRGRKSKVGGGELIKDHRIVYIPEAMRNIIRPR